MTVVLEDTTPDQQDTWQNVLEKVVVDEAAWDEIDPDILVLSLDTSDADTFGVYEFLWVLEDGRVAEAMVNQPYYYESFDHLLTAAHARTAAS